VTHSLRRRHNAHVEKMAFDRGYRAAQRREAVWEAVDVAVVLVIIGAGLVWVWWLFR